ncbi:mannose-ethanolamine phosphotransferase gpi13 [Balamuthia mandrillaris]
MEQGSAAKGPSAQAAHASSPASLPPPFFLAFFLVAQLTAALLFMNGFFLARYPLPLTSTCQTLPSPSAPALFEDGSTFSPSSATSSALEESGCWQRPKRFQRAILIIIDALRFDFTVYNSTLASSRALDPADDPQLYYRNQLPIIHQLLSQRPDHSLLFRFEADAPTTTMQRLKALTTGGIPTFLEAAQNFASSAIWPEDNLIHQLRANGRRLIFMGDDTWTLLFPPRSAEEEELEQAGGGRGGEEKEKKREGQPYHYFRKSYPYPSFNVKDLHTVDDGILKHLLPELLHLSSSPNSHSNNVNDAYHNHEDKAAAEETEQDWDVLIAHFLGVDHAGHRFGPEHPQMRDKLRQMNGVLEDIVYALDHSSLPPTNKGEGKSSNSKEESKMTDTILFVMGDHGMTADGNHGGATDDEVGAALFVYSPAKLRETRKAWEEKQEEKEAGGFRTVSQMDLVPTLSLLLGVPIPFGNLGVVIPELFFPSAPQTPLHNFFLKDAENKEMTLVHESEEQQLQWLRSYETLNTALHLNCWQIKRYIWTYTSLQNESPTTRSPSSSPSPSASMGSSFPIERLKELERDLIETSRLFHSLQRENRNEQPQTTPQRERIIRQHQQVVSGFFRFQRDILDMSRKAWATFDVTLMLWGLVLLWLIFISLLLHVILLRKRDTELPSSSSSSSPTEVVTNGGRDNGYFCLLWRREAKGGKGWRSEFAMVLLSGCLTGLFAYLVLSKLLMTCPSAEDASTPESTTRDPSPALYSTTNKPHIIYGDDKDEEELSLSFLILVTLKALLHRCYITIISACFVSSSIPLLGVVTGSTFLHLLLFQLYCLFCSFFRPSSPLSSSFTPSSFGSSLHLRNVWSFSRDTILKVLAIVCVLLHGVGLFSNSYIEAEPQVVQFLLISMLMLHAWHGACSFASSNKLSKSLVVGELLLVLLSVRFGPSLVPSLARRQEAAITIDTNVVASFSLFGQDADADGRSDLGFILVTILQTLFSPAFLYDSILPLSIFVLAIMHVSDSSSSPSNYYKQNTRYPQSSTLRTIQFCLLTALTSTFIYWLLLRCTLLEDGAMNGSAWLRVLLPRATYAFSLLSIILITFCLHHQRQHHLTSSLLLLQWLVLSVAMPVMLVLGPRSSWTVVLALVQGHFFIRNAPRLHSMHQSHPQQQKQLPMASLVTMALFGMHYFFQTGHACAFSALQFESAFVGLEETSLVFGGLLVALNTWSSFCLFIFGLPLMAWQHFDDQCKKGRTQDTNERRFPLLNDFSWALFAYMLFFAFNFGLTAAFVFKERRHLMVWRVFAPKFAFDGLTLLAVDVLLCLVSALLPSSWSFLSGGDGG